ncbi:MAG: sigma 54-interacting transcriptional regulator [Candidatus Cloacimonetes bacterium]|nr:sigma 54-interacting transcriptional regulator [Candidatus Cloacimonadota bacterium]
MDKSVDEVLSVYVTKNLSLVRDIIGKFKTDESQIIEVIGDSGSGKSFIFNKLSRELKQLNIEHKIYIPYIFHINQIKQIVSLITDITEEYFQDIIKQANDIGISTNKYDFFYFLTSKIEERRLFKVKHILIYEGFYLDKYTLDFIQYLVEYFTEEKVNFVIFTRSETYPFSEKFHIKQPNREEIAVILQSYTKNTNLNYAVESELIQRISGGNLSIIAHIMEKYFADGGEFDFTSQLDQSITLEGIYEEEIKRLDEEEKKLLFTIFLLDTDTSALKELYAGEDITLLLDSLMKHRLIFAFEGNYLVKKVSAVRSYFNKLPRVKQKHYFKPVINRLKPAATRQMKVFIKDFTLEDIEFLREYYSGIRDADALINIYEAVLTRQNPVDKKAEILKQLGISHKQNGQEEQAIEIFRKTLKLCVENSLPAEEVVYYLAETLFSVNSSNFALEIIRKYSPESINLVMKCRILLVKAEILMDMEKFDDALMIVSDVNSISDDIDKSQARYAIKAKLRKMKGLIYYYSNEWGKAQSEFEEAENHYKNTNDIKGLAAVYNNLGGLSMLQGDWDKTEDYFLKSLDYEKKLFSLSGISGCYSNLGYLYEDKNNYEKSLEYLNEALRIQKLLGDRDVISTIYINIGVAYMDNGKFKEAEEAFNNLLEISIKFNLYRNLIAALNNLGALYFKSGDWNQARDFYERAIKRSQDHGFSEGICKSYNNLGELYEKRGEYILAFECYSKSEELIPSISDDFLKAELFGNLGSVLTYLHKFKEAYGYLVESYDFFKNLNARDKIIEGAEKQAYYFIQTRNYESANYYLDIALKLAEELNNNYQVGRCHYLKSILEKNNPETAIEHLQRAIQEFVKSRSNYDLALANYEFAIYLFEKEEWEQALQLLKDNKSIIKSLGAIKFLEKNDIFIDKIEKKYALELKESKEEESLLNKFYEITQNLNKILDFDILLDTALDRLVEFSDADGGIFCLYKNQLVKDSWEYMILNNFSTADKDFSTLMNYIEKTFSENTILNLKQPQALPEYNNIISFSLSVRNDKKGVICLFTKKGAYYFTERMFNLLSALCNQIVVIVDNISYENLQKTHAVIREELSTASTYANIIGKSKKIQDIFQVINKIKDTPTTILLEGPSGTGKELIARAIHFNSNRRNSKFVAQYCGALPETLLESELFGHIKGSFTGATHDKKGLFEIANGGTFFLDEIADISLSTQAKLLRFLQEGEIKRVGSTKTEKVDVRVICATNVPLKEKVEKGEFRLDLYYRLNVIRIYIPSLKERKTDIPLLAVHFLDKYCKKINKKVNGITDEAMKYMMNYDWPGNIRQLENEIERAVTLAESDVYIKSSDLSEEIFRFQENTETISLLEKESLKDAVEKLERDMILKTLEDNNWNQTKTARELGLSRQGLIKKIQRYKLEK